MIPLDSLQQDHATLTKLLAARRSVSTETIPISARIVWGIYLVILEDAVSTLNSLIDHLSPRGEQHT